MCSPEGTCYCLPGRHIFKGESPVFNPKIGSARSEAHQGVARGRPPGPPERTKEEGRNNDRVRVWRPSRGDEGEHAAAGRRLGADGERGEVVVRNCMNSG